jgi:hypothetical protein
MLHCHAFPIFSYFGVETEGRVLLITRDFDIFTHAAFSSLLLVVVA